jgi:hypothetical protein
MGCSLFPPLKHPDTGCVWGLQAYVDRYDYEHIPIAGAVDEHEGQGGVAFSLSVDRQVCPKPSAYKEQHEAGEAVPTDTTGVVFFPLQDTISVSPVVWGSKPSVYKAQHEAGRLFPRTPLVSFQSFLSFRGELGEAVPSKSAIQTYFHLLEFSCSHVESRRCLH